MDPTRAPVTPRDASTVVVVRDRPGGIEIFCVERHSKSGFLGGAVVFPGGKVEPSDHADLWQPLTTSLSERARAFAEEEATARAFAVAALREALEEAAIVPVVGDALHAEAVEALRKTLASPNARDVESALAAELGALNLVLDTGRLEAISRWVTPTFEPRRFDTRFYLLALPRGQVGAHDDHETTRSFWATPDEILERWQRGEVLLAPPTSWTVTLFRTARNAEEAFAIARRQTLRPVEPLVVQEGESTVIAMPGDPLHPDPEPAGASAEDPTRFVLEGGRFVPRRAS